ncbi:hypothetical protein TWF718_002017 [Orbilia javanica]|uniref:F-box domain-containing protein n=1 Tax=Orbilia javanica TaxID=47235 RepID=A0AAN8N266_9PEZI
MSAQSQLSDPRSSLLSLPLDIHTILLDLLSPSDISKLRTLSHASYEVFSSSALCSHYLSLYGIFLGPRDNAKAEFDRFFFPRDRIRKGKPTRATIVDGLRMTNLDAPYFTTSHAYQNGDSVNHDGVVAYRTNAGDLALLDLSNPSNSSVLLMTETWEFTTQSLAEYNRNGRGVAVMGSIKERISTGWWTAESFKDKGIGLKKFEVNVHNDFGGEVLFVELSWIKEARETAPYDVLALLSAAHTPLPIESERTWHPIIARTKSLGMVISLKPENFGHPIAFFSLPPSQFPYAEYCLNSSYIAGIVPTTHQFAFIRYARDDTETVCSIKGVEKEGHGSQLFWGLQEYFPSVLLLDLGKMGLSEFNVDRGLMFVNNTDIHVQPDKAGELVFIATGAGVTAFDITRTSQYGGLTALKTFWWRYKNGIRIYINPNEDLDGEESKSVGYWREGMWARTAEKSDWGMKLIAPSIPRIWKSFVPGKVYGGGEGDDEMFTIVRGYSYVVRVGEGEVAPEHAYSQVPAWQRPEFLIAWELPLTRKGVEKYTFQTLNRRAGFPDLDDDKPPFEVDKNGNFSVIENPEGIYPNKIMHLQTALTTNLAGVLRCFEAHLVLAVQMPQMIFAKRDTHKTKSRWLGIDINEIMVEGDEYREIVGPVEKGRWKPEKRVDLLKLSKRQERVLFIVPRNGKLQCERPYPRTVRFGKRRSGLMSMFLGKGGNLQPLSEKSITRTPELEVLPKGNIHHVKVGDSGNYIAYVTNVSPVPTEDSGGPSGTLVIVRYDH